MVSSAASIYQSSASMEWTAAECMEWIAAECKEWTAANLINVPDVTPLFDILKWGKEAPDTDWGIQGFASSDPPASKSIDLTTDKEQWEEYWITWQQAEGDGDAILDDR